MVVHPLISLALLAGSYLLAMAGRAYVPRLAGLHFLVLMTVAFFAEILVLVLAATAFVGR